MDSIHAKFAPSKYSALCSATQHSLLSHRPTCSLLLLVLSQVLTACSTPLVPILCHFVSVLTNFHRCQIFLCQIPPSPSLRTSAGLCLGQPPKKTLFCNPIVLHPGNRSKPLQTTFHQFRFYCRFYDVSPIALSLLLT